MQEMYACDHDPDQKYFPHVLILYICMYVYVYVYICIRSAMLSLAIDLHCKNIK